MSRLGASATNRVAKSTSARPGQPEPRGDDRLGQLAGRWLNVRMLARAAGRVMTLAAQPQPYLA
jgi:hypothetical protein